jgi:hypothetical protein
VTGETYPATPYLRRITADEQWQGQLVRVAGDLGAVAGSGAPDKRHLTSVARPSRTRSADGRIGA